mmetsp:Transcript_6394/g.12014  ORF Transcript_6394/g.12014 Transcript_6394/m.12014 type:complete len:1332 (-) Transcript_6394:571-4566(-)
MEASLSIQTPFEQLDSHSETSSDEEEVCLEDIDANTEEGRLELHERLSALEMEISEAKDKLTDRSIQEETQNIYGQLFKGDACWEPDILEVVVQHELQEYEQRCIDKCGRLGVERNLIQAYIFKADCANTVHISEDLDNRNDAPSEEEENFLENIDVDTEEGQQQLLDRLLELESEIEEAQENLEEESLLKVTEEVRDELIQTKASLDENELEAQVEEEVQEYKQRWSDECERLEDERSLVQDRLQDLGMDLRSVYQDMERLTAERATTEAWKKAARPNCELSQQAVADQLDADAELAESSPIVHHNGKIMERGASGFLKPCVKDMLQAPPEGDDGWDQLSNMYDACSPAELAELMPDNEEATAVYDLCNEDHPRFKIGSAVDQLTAEQTRNMRRCDESQDIAKETRHKQKALRRMANAKRARSRRANQLESNDIVANPEPIWVDTPPDISVEDNMLSALNGATSSNNGEGRGGDDDPSHKRPKVGSSVENQSPQVDVEVMFPVLDNEFSETTKEVQQKERARLERLKEWEEQRKKANCPPADNAVINPRRPMHEPPVLISPILAYHLQPHQLGGVRFMWENLIGDSVMESGNKGTGCILAHSMGLGKTLQVITLLHTMLTRFSPKNKDKYGAGAPSLRTALILTPVNIIYNWRKQLEFWTETCPDDPLEIFMMEDTYTSAHKRLEVLERWHACGGIMLMGYEKYRILSTKNEPCNFAAALQNPGPDILVCDEGHIIKNNKSNIALALAGMRTLRRVALTGSPLQNSVMEYYCMVDFVRKGFLGDLVNFKNRFEAPITAGQHVDSTQEDVKLMKYRAHVLHCRLQGFVQRIGVEVLREQLPPKYETVICIRLSQLQRRLYQHCLDTFKPQLKMGSSSSPNARQANGGGLLNMNSNLLKVWNHPDLLHDKNNISTSKQALPHATSSPSGNLASSSNPLPTSNNPGSPAQPAGSSGGAMSNGFSTLHPSGSGVKSDLEKQNSGCVSLGNNEALEVEAGQNVPWYEQAGLPKWWTDDEPADIVDRSGKLAVAMTILQDAATRNEKTLLFSQCLGTLNLFEKVLQTMKWSRETNYFRMDGRTPGKDRQMMVEKFNSHAKDSLMLMIISTRAGSLGLNLVGASRVILLDTLWNPSHELQAVFRAYRYGQNRPVHVYRLLTAGTMEEKMYWRQITKQCLAARIVDKHQVPRTVPASQHGDIYTLDPDNYWDEQGNEDTPIVLDAEDTNPHVHPAADNMNFNKQEDPILTNLLIEHPKWIKSCFEHQSLLQNIEEERLNAEEQQAAWQGYERDLNAPVAPPLSQALTSNNPNTPKDVGKASTSSNAGTCFQERGNNTR